MGRRPCCDKVGLKKGKWTAEEDEKLVSYIKENGEGSWRSLPKNAGLLRCGKSCRLRWINYLKDDLKRGNITPEEEETIIKLQASLGNRWSLIASHLIGRTDNEIKNHWNSHLSRRITPDPPVKKKRGRKAKSATATTGTTTTATTTKKNKKSKHQNKPPSSPKDESTQETTNSVITDEPNQSSPEVGSETLTVTTPDGSGATSSEKPTESGGNNGGEGDQVEFDMEDLDLEGLLGDNDLWKEVNGDLWSLGFGENDMMGFEQLGENGGHMEGVEEGVERWFDWDSYSNDGLFEGAILN